MEYIVIDLEATCWKFPKGREKQEIIEIGAVKLDPYGGVVDTFQSMVKPVMHPVLSHFCIALTNIKQSDVEYASEFPKVADDFVNWIGEENVIYMAAWGSVDQEFLKNACDFYDFEYFWTSPIANLKKQYSHFKGLAKPIGLKKAVEKEGFEFTGNHHRALDDAINTAKIFEKYLDEWVFLG